MKEMKMVLYLCDRKRCESCYEQHSCFHTSDILHAVNYEPFSAEDGTVLGYVEKNRNMAIQEMDLSVRTKNILTRAGIYSTDRLTSMTKEEIRNIPKMTKISFKAILDYLDYFGYELIQKKK